MTYYKRSMFESYPSRSYHLGGSITAAMNANPHGVLSVQKPTKYQKFVQSIMGDAKSMATPSPIAGLSGVGAGIRGLFDNNAHNDGTAVGQTIGSAGDTILNSMGIPTFGLVGKAGSWIGSQFNSEEKPIYTPSGNTSGAFPEFKSGGKLSRKTEIVKKYQVGGNKDEGFYGTYPMSTSGSNRRSSYEFYLEPKKREHLAKLEKQYDLPEGFLASIAMKESGTGKIIRDSEGRRRLIMSPTEGLVSSANAQGPFQFQPATGREYGLNSSADRNDFYKASEAAAKKLSEDRKRFGSLHNAMMSYNWGSGNTSEYLAGKKDTMPSETSNYITRMTDYREQLTGYPSSLESSSIPTVTAPRPNNAERAKGVRDFPQAHKAEPLVYKPGATPNEMMAPLMYQKGGEVKDAQVEIEGGEYVFNAKGLDENNFKMLDNTGKKHDSQYGFLALGQKHKQGNTGGIKVKEGDAYIASEHLGMDGKKSGKGNPSVASMMLRNGGKALAKGNMRKWDRFGINKWNPKSVQHHLTMMNNVKNEAEKNKAKVQIQSNIKQAEKQKEENKKKLDKKLRKAKKGGLIGNLEGVKTTSNLGLDPNPISYWKRLPQAYAYENQLTKDIKDSYYNSINSYPYVTHHQLMRKGGSTLKGYSDYEKYYNALPHDKKLKVSSRLKNIPKAELGGQIRNILDEMYSEESLYAMNSEGL